MKDEAMTNTSEDAEQMEYDHSVYVHTTLCIEVHKNGMKNSW